MIGKLKRLNFEVLLKYPKTFDIKNRYEIPIECNEFCIDCEKKKLTNSNNFLEFMSHGCSIEDYEKCLGKINYPIKITDGVMIILENPGGNYGFYIHKSFHGINKFLPLKHYYWTPSVNSWPKSLEQIEKHGNFYGTYFAYLMVKYGLKKCYITNYIKCKMKGARNNPSYKAVAKNCFVNYLKKEIKIFDPRYIICMGKDAYNLVMNHKYNSSLKIEWLYHPSAIKNRSQTFGKTRMEMLKENEMKLNKFLK